MRKVSIVLLVLVSWLNLAFGAAPHRKVEKNTINSDSLPAIQIRVDEKMQYLGSFPFRIGDIASGERMVFAETQGKKIRRMFIAQFESFLPDSKEIYHYSFDNAIELGGHKFRHSTFAYSSSEAIRENPKSEAALTAAFLQSKGLEPEDMWVSSRFLTLGDINTRRDELILFYLEPLSSVTKQGMDSLFQNDEPTTKWTNEIAPALKERSFGAFAIVK